jgi:hypothetical protein
MLFAAILTELVIDPEKKGNFESIKRHSMKGRLMVTLDTVVDRKVALCILVPFMLTVLIVVFVLYGLATLEFGYADWVRKATCLPAITEIYSAYFRWSLVLPIGLSLWGAFLIRKTSCSLGGLLLFAGTECIVLTIWTTFSVLAFFLGHQTYFAK